MSVTIVLAEGFAGEGVELVAGGRTYLVTQAQTSLLTGMADEVVIDAEDEPVSVEVRLIASTSPWTSYDLPQGAVLVLELTDGRLAGRVAPGPLGFA